MRTHLIKSPSIARIFGNEVKSFISNAADRIEQNVESFDPNKFLGKVFEGGLQRLSDFGSMVEKMNQFLQDAVSWNRTWINY